MCVCVYIYIYIYINTKLVQTTCTKTSHIYSKPPQFVPWRLQNLASWGPFGLQNRVWNRLWSKQTFNGVWRSAGRAGGGAAPFRGPKIDQICTEWLHEEALVQQESEIGRFFIQKVVKCSKNKTFKFLRVFPFQIESGVAQGGPSSPSWGALWAHKGSLSTLLVPKRPSKEFENF